MLLPGLFSLNFLALFWQLRFTIIEMYLVQSCVFFWQPIVGIYLNLVLILFSYYIKLLTFLAFSYFIGLVHYQVVICLLSILFWAFSLYICFVQELKFFVIGVIDFSPFYCSQKEPISNLYDLRSLISVGTTTEVIKVGI